MYAASFLGICPEIFKEHKKDIEKIALERIEDRSVSMMLYNGFKG